VSSAVLADEVVLKWLEGNTPKKVIFVKGKIVNIVV
jgi:leucyl-tRNA synthetase